MKFEVKASLSTFDDGNDYDIKDEFEAKDWNEAEEKARDIYYAWEDSGRGFRVICLDTNEEREFEEEQHTPQDKIDRLNAIYANAYPDIYNET